MLISYKEDHYIMLKRFIRKILTIENLYISNKTTSNSIRLKLTELRGDSESHQCVGTPAPLHEPEAEEAQRNSESTGSNDKSLMNRRHLNQNVPDRDILRESKGKLQSGKRYLQHVLITEKGPDLELRKRQRKRTERASVSLAQPL